MFTLSLYQEQKKTKPKIEDVIPEYLDGDVKNLALDFVACLRAYKMNPAWTLTNQWKAVCKGKNLFRICLDPWNPQGKNRKWVVVAYLQNLDDYAGTVITEGLQQFLYDSVYYCVNKPSGSPPGEEFRQYAFLPPCNGWNCAPGKDITVCGKELTNICRNSNRQYFWFHDPDNAVLSAIKRFLELERFARVGK
jgi:hypothetical protein